jgi:hypothetical protein
MSEEKALKIKLFCIKMLQQESGKLNVEFFRKMEEKLPEKER